MTDAPKRGRPPKAKEWNVGKFKAVLDSGEYTLWSGNALIMRTTDEDKFKKHCELIEGRN